MKTENIVVIILIVGAGSLVSYFIISNWWSQEYPTIPHGISCNIELNTFQGNLELSKRQQTEAIIMTNQTLEKLIDDSSYCEFMGLGTLYTEYGSYQVLNINLNDTKELTVQVSLQNNLVVSYSIHDLARTYPAVSVEPFGVILPYLFFGIVAAGITIYFFKMRKRK